MDKTDGTIIIGTEIDTSGIDDGLENIKDEYDNEIIDIPTDKSSKGLQKILQISKKIGRSFLGISATTTKFLGNILTLVTKLGLLGGLIGIVALIGLGIARAFKEAIDKDEELENKLEYLKFAMGSAFENVGNALVNVFKWLIDRVYDLMAILGAVIKLMTGFNIFSKATAKNFANANKSAGGLKKTLAGFDEMNILNEDGSTGLFGNISNDLNGIRDLSTEVETMSNKLKDWFKITLPSRQQIEETYKPMRDFWDGLDKWFDENVINPMTNSFKGFAEVTKPLWKPIADEFKKEFSPLYNYANENFLKPLSEKLSTYKDNFLKKYAKFINKIIYYINFAFGAFGVNLEYIDEESAITGDDIKENIGNSLDKVKEKAEKTKTPFDNLYDKLKELTSKTWKIVTSFVSGGVSSSTANSWLQPLRDKLAQIGIKLPHFAKGGIVNMPSRGVPVGSAIAGERGAEGVIPLTDSQQMALLGEAIGKYITINANITNTMNGRVISKELQRVQNDSDFAFNR